LTWVVGTAGAVEGFLVVLTGCTVVRLGWACKTFPSDCWCKQKEIPHEVIKGKKSSCRILTRRPFFVSRHPFCLVHFKFEEICQRPDCMIYSFQWENKQKRPSDVPQKEPLIPLFPFLLHNLNILIKRLRNYSETKRNFSDSKWMKQQFQQILLQTLTFFASN
jgi:hypothetical protein